MSDQVNDKKTIKAEWIRKYRAEGRDVSTMARNKAKNMAVQWVRSNHPEVWEEFMAQAREKVQRDMPV